MFHTGEGGALFCKPNYFETMYSHHNFGHDGPENFHSLGVNAKMSEPQAAMGLAVFPYMNTILEERKKVVDAYNNVFINSGLQLMKIREYTSWNYSYYPVIFKDENQLLKVKQALESVSIFPRRYFYPSLNTLPYIEKHTMEVSESISSRVLCLPLYVGLEQKYLKQIVDIIKESLI